MFACQKFLSLNDKPVLHKVLCYWSEQNTEQYTSNQQNRLLQPKGQY